MNLSPYRFSATNPDTVYLIKRKRQRSPVTVIPVAGLLVLLEKIWETMRGERLYRTSVKKLPPVV